MGSNYRDSYFQFQHLARSQSVLYREWMADEPLPAPDEVFQADGQGRRAAEDGGDGASWSVPPTHGGEDALGPSTVVSEKYWDVFDDDEQWETFAPANLVLESNGNVIYSKVVGAAGDPVSRETQEAGAGAGTGAGAGSGTAPTGSGANADDGEAEAPERDVIVGSVFDPRTLARIRAKVTGWDDVRVPELR